jgi:hypothetical protein
MKRSTRAATVLAVLATLTVYGTAALADPSASTLPPNWHIHDGMTGLGPEHKGIGFFPAILGVSTATYLTDPASCPDATDKAFLPQGRQDEQPLRAGMCQTSSKIIHLRTVPVGTAGPEGWSSITSASEPGWVTYYLITDR